MPKFIPSPHQSARPARLGTESVGQSLGSGRLLLLSVIAAVTVASLYYGQPILASVGRSLGISADAAGWIVVTALIGNAVGQVLVVPLGDQVERRRLTQFVLGAQLVGLIAMAAAPNLAVAMIASAIIGLGGAGAMTLLPYAAGLVTDSQRGRVTGAAMSGVLFGILLSRSVSGFLSSWIGWRTIYVIAAVLCACAILALHSMPASRGTAKPLSYGQLVRSLASVIGKDRLVQRHMALGALGFLSFNLLWTGLTLLLSNAPYQLSDAVIGIFGLLGAAGALVARNAGRWHDRGYARATLWCGWAALTAAWAIMAPGTAGGTLGVTVMILGVLVLDIGMQAQHITNQSILLSARKTQAGRVTTAYMGTNVIAGAVGSMLATQLFARTGWISLLILGVGCGAVALVILATSQRGERRRADVARADSRHDAPRKNGTC